MRIIQINASYKPAYIYGGPTMSVSRLSEELVKAGVDTEVFTTKANGETELNLKSGIKTQVDGVQVTYFRRITKGNSHFSPALLFSLWKSLKVNQAYHAGIKTPSNIPINKPSNSITIIHIHAWWNLVSVGSCIIALMQLRAVMLSPRGTLSNYSFGNRTSVLKNIFHKILGKALLKRCHYHVSSEKEKQDILKIISPKSITIIPNFVNLAADYDSNKFMAGKKSGLPGHPIIQNPGYFNILFLSRIEEKKGLDNLFHALQKIDINFHLTIAGTGNPDYILFLKSLAVKLGIIDRITWIGQQGNEEKFKVISAHDLIVLPSHDESFANVVIESLSVGTPVLISSKVGLADYVVENDLGWVYSSTPEELALGLKTAMQDTEKRKSIHLHAPGKIVSDFNEKKLLTQYLQLYQNVLAYV